MSCRHTEAAAATTIKTTKEKLRRKIAVAIAKTDSMIFAPCHHNSNKSYDFLFFF